MENKKIIFYHRAGCPQCRTFELLIKKNHVEVESCMDEDIMREKGIQHTPALEVDGRIIYGKEAFAILTGK